MTPTTFKTIKLGTGLKTADDFRKALKEANCSIGYLGNDILGKPAFKVADKETEVELIVVSNAELGFENGTTVKETYARAKELGLDLCPNEVGPQLRLQYKDQPKGEWLLVAMEPITDSVGNVGVFHVERRGDGKLWLGGSRGNPDHGWDASTRWVFLRRKSLDTLDLDKAIKLVKDSDYKIYAEIIENANRVCDEEGADYWIGWRDCVKYILTKLKKYEKM